MKRLTTMIASLAVLFCLFIFNQAEAARKESYIGDIVEKLKNGVATVKEDFDNYNTFIFELGVYNHTTGGALVEVYKKQLTDSTELDSVEPIFSRWVYPGEHIFRRLESKAYPLARTHTLVIHTSKNCIDFIHFNPSKKDSIYHEINQNHDDNYSY
jgi:hypothetical protein